MNIREYYEIQTEWLFDRVHPKTLREIGVAVDAFCMWLNRDVDIDDVTLEMVEEWEAADRTIRRRQLTSNLLSLLRMYDEAMFPRRANGIIANAKHASATEAPREPKEKPESFSELARLYCSRRTLSEGYANTLRKRSLAVEKWMGKTDLADVLSETAVNQFLASIEGAGAPATVRKWRQDILTLWRSAADDDLVPYPVARRIRRLAVEPKTIECYEIDEVRRLVVAAGSLKGGYDNGILRKRYWSAIIRFAWDTGLRRGDCWRFNMSVLRDDGSFRIVQHKTKRPVRRMLQPDTIAAIKRIGLELPFEWSSCEWCFGEHFQRLLPRAGVDRGTFKWLRRACGSNVEATNPGAGCKVLGNTEQVFRQHYNADLATEILMPPKL